MSANPGARGRRAGQAGFTLIEAVMVIVITGILGGIVAVFIKAPVQAYTDAAARAELSDIADTAVRRIGRDVRLALPNSVSLSNDGLTLGFLLTKTGGRYQAAEDGLAGGLPLSFTNPAALAFTVLGAMPNQQQTILPGDFIVVYNLGAGYDPADAYTRRNVATVASVADNTINMVAPNPFAAQIPTMSSPTSRFQVVNGTVIYSCNLAAGTLTRYETRGVIVNVQNQALPSAGDALIATNVTGCAFNSVLLANTRSALVEISVTLQRPGPDGPVTLFHQVHVDNTP